MDADLGPYICMSFRPSVSAMTWTNFHRNTFINYPHVRPLRPSLSATIVFPTGANHALDRNHFNRSHNESRLQSAAGARYAGPYLRGGHGFNPPPEIITRKFVHCIKITCSIICGLWCLASSLWNARKSHLASTKCNKPLGRSGLRPGPRWGSFSPPRIFKPPPKQNPTYGPDVMEPTF